MSRPVEAKIGAPKSWKIQIKRTAGRNAHHWNEVTKGEAQSPYPVLSAVTLQKARAPCTHDLPIAIQSWFPITERARAWEISSIRSLCSDIFKHSLTFREIPQWILNKPLPFLGSVGETWLSQLCVVTFQNRFCCCTIPLFPWSCSLIHSGTSRELSLFRC